MKKIWDEFETTKKKPKVRDFNSVGIFARNLLGFYDRNRPGCYQFTNSHWGKRRKVWYPSGTTEEDYFPGVPDGANVYEKPEDKRPADAYTIRLTGENLKLKLSQAHTKVSLFTTISVKLPMKTTRAMKNYLKLSEEIKKHGQRQDW